jgi:hypothetical protein
LSDAVERQPAVVFQQPENGLVDPVDHGTISAIAWGAQN